MFCAECGTRNTPDSKYCKECGARIDEGYRKIMLSIDDTSAVQDAADQERLTQLLDMAFWHNEAGHTDSALRACEAALVIHPNCTTAHSLLGTLFEKKGDDDRAIRHFERVVELNPASAADAAKLDQIKRGVHVKAAAPPFVYRWVPPALTGLALGGLRSRPAEENGVISGSIPQSPKRNLPVLAAAAATVAVFAVGLAFVLRQPAAVQMPSPPARPVGVARAPIVQASPPAPLPPPVYLPTSPTTAAVTQEPTPDPFAGSPVAAVAPGDFRLARINNSSGRSVRRSTRSARAGVVAALPPLNLEAVPLDTTGDAANGSVSPAPVAAPGLGNGAHVTATVADVPQHIVPVTQLSPASAPPQQELGTSSAPITNTVSHIRITIHSDSDSSGEGSSQDADGDSYQQQALALQEQGDYAHARDSYRKAIRAYKSQIAAGVDADAAQRGLQASQTGLQICEQGQH